MTPDPSRARTHPLRLPRVASRSNVKSALLVLSQLAAVLIGLVVLIHALDYGRALLAPVGLAVIVGLMFGPPIDRIERYGVPPWISAAVAVLGVLILLIGVSLGFGAPIADWVEKLPSAWSKLQPQIAAWKGAMRFVAGLQSEVQGVFGQAGAISVNVQDGAAVKSVASVAPAVFADALLFLASLYFYIATRRRFRLAVLSLCLTRRLRWRTAHIFRDVEQLVSRYLLSITVVNAGMGAAVAIGLWLIDVPSALLWGLLASVLNFVTFLGPAVMIAILLGVGLISGETTAGVFAPAALFLSMHLLESQFITPHVLGLTMTLNPFMIFLSVAFWIWIWGPLGGFIAVPALLVLSVVMHHLLPAPPQRAAGSAARA